MLKAKLKTLRSTDCKLHIHIKPAHAERPSQVVTTETASVVTGHLAGLDDGLSSPNMAILEIETFEAFNGSSPSIASSDRIGGAESSDSGRLQTLTSFASQLVTRKSSVANTAVTRPTVHPCEFYRPFAPPKLQEALNHHARICTT